VLKKLSTGAIVPAVALRLMLGVIHAGKHGTKLMAGVLDAAVRVVQHARALAQSAAERARALR
jgi:hypothetical protein